MESLKGAIYIYIYIATGNGTGNRGVRVGVPEGLRIHFSAGSLGDFSHGLE
jgi:hypothetical protein